MGWFASKQEKLNKRLIKACAIGKLAEIEQLLAEGADINAKDSEGDTPLIYAIAGQYSGAVKLLIEKGAGVSARSIGNYGRTALHRAATTGIHESVIPLLLEKGVDINARDDSGETALHRASCYGQFSFVKALIAHGADPGIRDNGGNRAEESAHANHEVGIANFLREQTAPAVIVSTGWKLTAPDEIVCTSEKSGTDYCLTEIFNFNSRIYTQIARNMKTNAESQAMRFFDEFPDTKVLEQARQQLVQLGGNAASATVVRGTSLNKQTLS